MGAGTLMSRSGARRRCTGPRIWFLASGGACIMMLTQREEGGPGLLEAEALVLGMPPP